MQRTHSLLAPLLAVTLSACGVSRVGAPSNTLQQDPVASDQVRWPKGYEPEDAGFFVHNEIEVQAPADVIWKILVDAEAWPKFYEGATNVKVVTAPHGELAPNAEFTWSTMGLDFTSRVAEFVPPYRLSWESRKTSIQGYHAWLIVPTGKGCRVITDESQHGFLTLMQKIFVPNKLRRLHDVWLGEIKKKAELAAAGRDTPSDARQEQAWAR